MFFREWKWCVEWRDVIVYYKKVTAGIGFTIFRWFDPLLKRRYVAQYISKSVYDVFLIAG